MAYFPNGTAGDFFEEKYCQHCVHWTLDTKTDTWGCPVMDLHILHNYDQCKDTPEGKVVKEFLTRLIPEKPDGIEADDCSMFHPASKEERDAEHAKRNALKGIDKPAPWIAEWLEKKGLKVQL